LEEVKARYEITYDKYAILMFHPVTTEHDKFKYYCKELIDALLNTKDDYIVIYPNNDLGSQFIFDEYKRIINNMRFKIFPSIRFEYFLVLLNHASYIIGNSSSGIREAPYYGIPVINIGTRQKNRSFHKDIINCNYSKEEILNSIQVAKSAVVSKIKLFGNGNSDKLFMEAITKQKFWEIDKQKLFKDLVY